MSAPFENMAISLSGGGYRAAAFHLGALSYLDHVMYEGAPLLQRIKVISTISGGTFTGVAYVLALAQGKDFKACFHKLYALLYEDKLVVEALEMVNHSTEWQAPEKTRNMINAFSEVYQKKYCDGQQLSLLLQSPLGHLEEFCFNATDMYDTLPFRFQKTGKIGNGKIYLDFNSAREIRLGDVMAASSCFPGGFEPLDFPIDFISAKNSPLWEYWHTKAYPENIALMDGGILDNQGIESVELANQRRPDDRKIGTYIISDVSSRNAAPFEFPKAQKPKFWEKMTYQSTSMLLAIIAGMAILGTWLLWDKSRIGMILCLLTALLSSAALLGIFMLQRFIDGMVTGTIGQKSETPVILKNLDVLEKTPLFVLLRLARIRFFTLSDIVENTFMSRIRTLQNNNLFENEIWDHRLISNNIYSMYTDYEDSSTIPPPSPQMLATAEKAATMGTTLWFSTQNKAEGMLDILIIAGQMNLCFQLLRYFEKEKASFPPEIQPVLETLEKSIRADYLKFTADEKWLLHELLQPV